MAIKITHQFERKSGNCTIRFVQVDVYNVIDMAMDVYSKIIETSWLYNLDPIVKKSWEERARDTILSVVNEVIRKVNSVVSEDLGELVVSINAQNVLQDVHKHRALPLADLWKEKVRGNPGFDFHTESPGSFVVFGEAKYNAKSSAYTPAINQIRNFIVQRKDDKELSDLKHLVSAQTQANLLINELRGYAAAFSTHTRDVEKMFKHIISKPEFVDLLRFPEVYLIGVNIVN